MAEPEKDRPSLELPKLGWRRKPRPERKREAEREVQREAQREPVTEETRPVVVAEPEHAPAPELVAEPEPEPEPRRRAKREWKPGGMAGALLSGLVVGLGIVGLTWASLRSCETVQGTSSCGDVGYPMLGLILVVMVLVGWLLLKLLRVADPASTSFLGTGLAVVVALLVLVDHLMDRSMVVVVPVICAATFGLAHWVTRTFIEPPRD
jgi:hypothetical protein